MPWFAKHSRETKPVAPVPKPRRSWPPLCGELQQAGVPVGLAGRAPNAKEAVQQAADDLRLLNYDLVRGRYYAVVCEALLRNEAGRSGPKAAPPGRLYPESCSSPAYQSAWRD